jgi:hypothetical protein
MVLDRAMPLMSYSSLTASARLSMSATRSSVAVTLIALLASALKPSRVVFFLGSKAW